jgi:FtsP/CotA-like multicopper oxidase with cupredoxin domain
MFFDVYRTGTSHVPHDNTDTVMLSQGERAILETTFRYPGMFMFHAHQSEFAELGWMGMFQAEEARRET